jgi:ABC-type dipeptide/oligopeptide/nickel transport system permease subunit
MLVPGVAHGLAGRRALGLALASTWLFLVATAAGAWDKIRAVPETGSLDDWVAVITLLVSLVFVWVAGVRGLGLDPRESAGESQWRIALNRFKKNRPALAGCFVIVLLYAVMLLAPLISPYDPIAQENVAQTSFLPPSPDHWFGTDRLGRDILSRILYGARISLSIGFIATLISITLGTLLGAIAGYAGGKTDSLVMRFTDMVLAFPRLILLILIVALFKASIPVIVLVLGLTQWPGTTRIVRGDVLSLREREFIQAAHALGFSRTRIILRHLVPNVIAPVIVSATLGIGNTIVLEAGLSFLGFGPPAPTPSWGEMVNSGRDVLIHAWWVATFPGLTIVLVVLAFNLVGDALRDALDPRLR